nr:MAG TPA: hypothetical protein [Bacteriophage sp.]
MYLCDNKLILYNIWNIQKINTYKFHTHLNGTYLLKTDIFMLTFAVI